MYPISILNCIWGVIAEYLKNTVGYLYIYFPCIWGVIAEYLKNTVGYLYIYFPCIREIWRFVHPRKVIFPSGNMTISRVNKSTYLLYAREINVLFHQANALVNSAKWNLLAIFVYKIIISEHLWSYMTKAFNLENFK